MTRMTRCTHCGAFVFGGDLHRCPPLWLVWCADYDEHPHDVRPTRGVDPQDAAETWAQEDDAEGDYTIIGGSEVTVSVVAQEEYAAACVAMGDAVDDLGEDELPPGLVVKRYVVSGEAVPSYRARELEPEDDGG
jgi:hypothetical protein